MTNKLFSTTDEEFKKACKIVNLPFTRHEKLGLTRQASKWRSKKGLAYKKEGRKK